MAISIKTPEDIEKMRVAGRLAAEVLEMIEPYVKPGVSTGELDRICNDYIVNEQHAVSACLGYHGYPKSVCISINEVVCHGIPDDAKLLKDGDIVNIDVTVIKDGFHGDTSKMFIVGKPTIMGERLCRITQESLYLALRMVKPGINLREIGAAIQKFVEAEGFSVVREYCGHGIGRGFHEEPQVLHYDSRETNVVLKPGMTFTIEPMVNAGKKEIRTMKDGWTAVEYTAELQGLMGQFQQSIESQLGQGTVDAMLQYAGTLDAGTQSTLERMVMSGDPAQMQRAVQYLQERMAGGSQTGYAQHGQPTAQPVGMSHAEFIAAYDQLSQWALQSGYGPGHRQYDEQYRDLVAQRSAGKRAGR